MGPDETGDNNQSSGLHEILTKEQIEFLDNERLWARNQVKLHEIILLMRRKIESSHGPDPSISRKVEEQARRIRIKEQVKQCDHEFKLVTAVIALIAFIILAFISSFSGPP